MPAAPIPEEGSPGRRELPPPRRWQHPPQLRAGSAEGGDTARPNAPPQARPAGRAREAPLAAGWPAGVPDPPAQLAPGAHSEAAGGGGRQQGLLRRGREEEGREENGAERPGLSRGQPRGGPRKARGARGGLGPDPGPRRDPGRAARRGGRRQAHLGLFVGHGERRSLLSCRFTKEVPGPHRTSTQAAPGAAEEGGGSGGGGRGRAHVVRSLPPPCVREHEPPGLPIGCCLAGARNAYITTRIPRPALPEPGPGARQAGGKRRGHAHPARRGDAPALGRGCIVLLLWWSLIKMASSWSSVGTRRLEA